MHVQVLVEGRDPERENFVLNVLKKVKKNWHKENERAVRKKRLITVLKNEGEGKVIAELYSSDCKVSKKKLYMWCVMPDV